VLGAEHASEARDRGQDHVSARSPHASLNISRRARRA
jgi:hypothetical protein